MDNLARRIPSIKVRTKSSILLAITVFMSFVSVAGNPSLVAAQNDGGVVRPDDYQSIIDETTFYDIVPLGACGTAADSEGVTLEGKDNIQKAFNYFITKGLTPVQSAGIVGNLRQESGVNPRSNQADGPGRGIAQWSEGARWDALLRWAENRQYDPLILQTQLDFIWHEMNNVAPWDETLPAMKAADTIEEATIAFEQKFERAGNPVMTNRIRYAQETLDAFGGLVPDNVAPSGACGGSGIVVDGYSFPVAPQTKRGYGTLPCNNPGVNYTDTYGRTTRIKTCHHDDSPAFDLMYDGVAGKPIYALTKGKIVKVNRSYVMLSGASGKPCGSIQFQSTNGNESTYYWYGHILPASNVVAGREFDAGDQLGTVATQDFGPKCWGGGPHLHIDRGCFNGTQPQQGGNDSCRDPQFLQDLQKIWEGLPAA